MTDAVLQELAQQLGNALIKRKLKLVTAESCTGGWISKVVTDIPGSSAWFDSGYITYSNAAKQKMLDVDAKLLMQYGAVSANTVEAMATAAVGRSGAQIAVAVSGVAGPDGGSVDKPVGTVWFAFAAPGYGVISEREHFVGDREAVRRAAVRHALQRLHDLVRI
ncbi:MAG: nicotinamide-nucleotide amidase [Gammaproteobacteria bacterium]